MKTKTRVRDLSLEERYERRQAQRLERQKRKAAAELAHFRTRLPDYREDIQRLIRECWRVSAAIDALAGDWTAADEDLVITARRLSFEAPYVDEEGEAEVEEGS